MLSKLYYVKHSLNVKTVQADPYSAETARDLKLYLRTERIKITESIKFILSWSSSMKTSFMPSRSAVPVISTTTLLLNLTIQAAAANDVQHQASQAEYEEVRKPHLGLEDVLEDDLKTKQ